MKRILTSAFALGLIGLIFTSCSRYSDLSIAKRHYRSGYYVEYNSGKKTGPTVQEAKVNTGKTNSTVNMNTLTNFSTSANNNNQKNSPAYTTSQYEATPKAPNHIANTKSNSALTTGSRNTPTTETTSDIHQIVPEQIKSIKDTKSVFNSTKNNMFELRHHGEGGGHSLLWWIIVIIIVVILIDLIAGSFLGNLLYLLILIALVLLVLRLLEML